MRQSFLAAAAIAALAACGQGSDEPAPAPAAAAPAEIEETALPEAAPAPQAAPSPDYAAALADARRPEGDVEDDEVRKAADVLAFIGAEPGMTIVELEAGGGYYTELLSRIVGSDGKVWMQNPAGFDSFLGDAIEQRLADGRLPNVEYMKTQFDALSAAGASADLVTWILGPHELWFIPEGSDGFGDPETAFAEIARVLKPGGHFVALDHSAQEGAPPEVGGTLHRIDKGLIRAMAEAAGLVFVSESDVLANPDDPRDANVFSDEWRRKTDRFLIKFQKPAG
ncbi:MAG: class I SAM-dependent methyltransferase [Pseudomonadota bacterium]